MSGWKYLVPAGIVLLLEYQERFRKLGLPSAWACSSTYRKAVQDTQLELVPRSLLQSLGCVVEVGANLGEWSIGMARLTIARRIIAAGARAVLNRTRALMIEVTFTSYYRDDLQFSDLNRLITSLAPFRLWGISAPHCAPSGKPMWADAVYVQSAFD